MSKGRQHKQYLARAHAMGGRTTVPAGDTIEVLEDLATRMSYTAIGKALGTSHNYVTRVIAGDIKRMNPNRHAAIMALGNYQPTDTSHIDAKGTRRRLQALLALGYSMERMEREIDGYSLTAIKDVVNGRAPVVQGHHALAVAEAYERLSMTLPVASNRNEASGISRARNTAARNGWPPPLAWDDIDRDERREVAETDAPDPVVIDRVLGGDMSLAKTATPAERAEIVRRWRADGRSLNELERMAGWQSRRYLDKGAA